MSTVTEQDLSSIDLADPALWDAGPPYELFARLQREAPVHFSRQAVAPDEGGFWSITRHEDVRAVTGRLDALVSNAGVYRPGPLAQYSVGDWDFLFAVNTRATWLLAKAAHQALKASRGAIVATGSMSGTNAHANLGAYGPSKAAVIMLVQVLAQEFGRDGIRVNSVSPGMVRTGMTETVYRDAAVAAERDALVPLGRVATPEDMADVIAFLLGNDARYVNGHDLVVDGGVSGNFLGRLPGIAKIPRG